MSKILGLYSGVQILGFYLGVQILPFYLGVQILGFYSGVQILGFYGPYRWWFKKVKKVSPIYTMTDNQSYC